MPLALYALTAGAFGIGVTEFVIMGLLPEVGTAFGVTLQTAGWLISGYALGVVAGAPLLTAMTGSWSLGASCVVLCPASSCVVLCRVSCCIVLCRLCCAL